MTHFDHYELHGSKKRRNKVRKIDVTLFNLTIDPTEFYQLTIFLKNDVCISDVCSKSTHFIVLKFHL